ncbi:hypothetical protein BCR36DRAFT_366691 [Piromyces finnis]|uniref:RING-type domain-containing protein n=1 Tax=Piromyces finnis TaxID=1754191 RepID=A0A1Y1VL40_9FUNG|nr:hypothetical protein BCR36DRAFT_366691 [Piromyces finnis]|eukprot:ORX58479.1 hypothetical protein BCR36DRAFT_366691 [Piromyces finnis]
MSNQQIETDSNLLSLAEMKGEEQVESPDSEELLIKASNKGKIKESQDFEDKPPLINEKKSNSSLSFKAINDNQLSYNVSKGKSTQKLYKEPSSSVISDIDQDNISVTTSVVTDASDINNIKVHQSNSQSLRNKRFSYNSPSNTNGHHWTTNSSTINNIASAPSSSSNVAASSSNSSLPNANNANSNSNNGRRLSLTSRGLSGSFVELINMTLNSNNNNSNNNNNNNNNINTASSQHPFNGNVSIGNDSHPISFNFENVDSYETEENNQRPSQVGPGRAAWILFRVYAVVKFLWSFVFSVLYFVHFIIIKSKSCDQKIYKYSVALTVVYAIQAISTLILIIYLPTSITRYTNVVRRRVVISNRAWRITSYTVIFEVIMVIIGAVLIFNKDPLCSFNENMAYVKITKVLIIMVISFYTLICLPFFLIPCICAFKLLPEYKGISDKVLKRFNSILYNPTEEVDEEDAPSCSICMENYKPGTRIKRLPCKHEFHPECITQWLETNNSW